LSSRPIERSRQQRQNKEHEMIFDTMTGKMVFQRPGR
jgi:hypothetical protein